MTLKLRLILMVILILYCTPGAEKELRQNKAPGATEIPSIIKVTPATPAKIKWPVEIDYEAITRLEEEKALEEAFANSQKQNENYTYIPWEERETLSFYETGLIFGGYYGHLTMERLGVSQDIYWDFEQSTVDNPKTISLWGYSGLCGEQKYGVALYDHNYQTGKILAQCVPGDILKIDTVYGTYIYEYESQEIGIHDDKRHWCSGEISIRTNDTGRFTGDTLTETFPDGLIESLANPSTIHNGALYYITCWPLDAYETDYVLVLKFRSLSGKKLV